MKNNIKFKILKAFLIFVGIVFSLFLILNYGPHVLPSLFTNYSDDFDKNRYEKIVEGTNIKVVDSLLGKPLRESISNVNPDSLKVIYWYTDEKSLGLAYEKIFILFYDDVVVDKIRVIDMD